MYLKSLELQGFKSFANKITLQFHNGITGVVGPNGSGKSNVSDAIRWVLGEQSAKQLRGGSMQDVIFAGTQSRRPMSFAYVAITFDNADHTLPVDYDEVTVARRLYRSGESEYMLNQTPVRMRDIQELFYDTGIGKEGYSLIGQGQVEKLLNGKPEERRELFDEAAGIVKYKRRKAAAVRKLENEQANLLRVNDILSELERQVGPLRQQSEKAKIYLARRDEQRICDANLYLIENDQYEKNLEDAGARLDNARKSRQETDDRLSEAKDQYEKAALQIQDIDAQTGRANEDLSQARIERQNYAGRIDLANDQVQALDRSDDELRERSSKIKNEIEQRKSQLDSFQKREKDLAAEIEKTQAEALAAQKTADALSSQAADVAADIDRSKEKIIQLLNERTGIQTNRQRASTMIEQMALREAELSRRELTLLSDEKEHDKSRSMIEEQAEDARKESESLNERLDRLKNELEGVQKSFLEESEKLAKLREEYQRGSSRLDTLRSMTERYEGYGAPIRRVMELREHRDGILGVVADLIKTSKKYELAVETALGGNIQNIVTDNEQTARGLIEFLKENRYGRATFLPLTAMKNSRQLRDTAVLEEPEVIGLASAIVECDARYEDLARNLLGRTVVIEDINGAIRIARKYHYSLRLVTLDGELLSPGGSMTGGAFRNNSNLLGRRREIDEESKKLKSLEGRIESLSSSVEKNHTRRNSLRDEITSVSGLIQKNDFEQSSIGQKMRDLSDRVKETGTEKEKLAQERLQIEKQKKELKSEQDAGSQELEKSASSEQQINARVEELEKKQQELSSKQEQADKKLSDIRLRGAGFTQEEKYIQQNIKRLEAEISSRQEEKTSIGSRLSGNDHTRENKRQEITYLTGQIEETKKREAQLSAALEELGRKKENISSGQKTFFDLREELSAEALRLDKEIFRLDEQLKKIEESRDNSVRYLWDEYELTPVACRELKRDDLGSKTAVQKRLAALKKEIKALGNVNVNAIDEYNELSQRYDFLKSQHEDLIKSAEDLQKIISKLDDDMRVRFKEQFSRLQSEFDHTFRELFGGGKGTLELYEDEDILDAGIRVIAQPPGKKLQNMLQLSGGEKSLTAIALLFAIQGLKPSPFCLLDEIESMLDEANVDRFAKYLRRLTKHTQFIIITHRRGSMAYCDRLYGITMQEKGVSALVSVDLEETA